MAACGRPDKVLIGMCGHKLDCIFDNLQVWPDQIDDLTRASFEYVRYAPDLVVFVQQIVEFCAVGLITLYMIHNTIPNQKFIGAQLRKVPSVTRMQFFTHAGHRLS